MADVERIARLLTGPQKALLEQDRPHFASGYRPGEKLVALGLLDRASGAYGFIITRTDFGLRVAQHLKQENAKS